MTASGDIQISVVIPFYNAAACVDPLCSRLTAVLQSLGKSFEILLIDDRSTDSSWQQIVSASHSDERLKGYRLSRNFGQHYAITAGLSISKGQWVVVMDCDLQERPEDIPALVDAAEKGMDIVLTRRKNREGSAFAKLGNFLFYKTLDVLTGEKYDPSYGALSLLSRRAVEAFLSMKEYHRYYLGSLKYIGLNTSYIDVMNMPRNSGKSSYTIAKRLRLGIDGIVSASTRLLTISAWIGVAFSFLAILYLIYILYTVIFLGYGVPGWPSVIAVNLLVGGVLAFLLAVIGMYIGRIYIEVRRRPLFFFDESTEATYVDVNGIVKNG